MFHLKEEYDEEMKNENYEFEKPFDFKPLFLTIKYLLLMYGANNIDKVVKEKLKIFHFGKKEGFSHNFKKRFRYKFRFSFIKML